MLKRKIETELLKWKNKKDKMCLVVKDARQVGKTYIIDKFARNNYTNYIYMNFDEMPSYKDIFNGDLDPETIIKQITLNIPNVNLVPNETIIFLDEIQNCPRARTALKFLSIDKRFDDIAKYALSSEKAKARECFLSIPKQLAKDYKKFQYSLVTENGSSRKFAGSLMWLHDARIINYCYNLRNLDFPLEGNSINNQFKIYMNDTGLLVSMLEEGTQKDIRGKIC